MRITVILQAATCLQQQAALYTALRSHSNYNLTLSLCVGCCCLLRVVACSCILPVFCASMLLMTSCRDPGILPRQEPDEEWLQGRKPR
jgi:hypothetical protein